MLFTWKPFSELSGQEVYEILQLRELVFVVEQSCPYIDCDGLDQESHHLLGRVDGVLLAYLRVLPPGLKFTEASIGRVVTAPNARRFGHGKQIIQHAVEKILREYGSVPTRISAQTYLENFYGSFGFQSQGSVYSLDGIPHVDMVLA